MSVYDWEDGANGGVCRRLRKVRPSCNF